MNSIVFSKLLHFLSRAFWSHFRRRHNIITTMANEVFCNPLHYVEAMKHKYFNTLTDWCCTELSHVLEFNGPEGLGQILAGNVNVRHGKTVTKKFSRSKKKGWWIGVKLSQQNVKYEEVSTSPWNHPELKIPVFNFEMEFRYLYQSFYFFWSSASLHIFRPILWF